MKKQLLFVTLLLCQPGLAAVENNQAGALQNYSPYVNQDYPLQVFWGDTHLHTSSSTDAGMMGNRLGPEEAYKFARGEVVTSSGGLSAKLQRPLDFLAITDHAENLGLAPMIAEKNPELLKTPFGKKISNLVYTGRVLEAFKLWASYLKSNNNPLKDSNMEYTYWQRNTSAAEKYYQPGRFTTLMGFEWSLAPNGNTLHRNVIFRDGKDFVDQITPASNYDFNDPEKLWEWLDIYEKKTGGKVLAIPHNGNRSQGLMFDDVTLITKEPLDKSYAERRMRWEPIYEVTQIKGDGEAHPLLSPDDEFADYGTWDFNFAANTVAPEQLPRSYARAALKRGLKYKQSLGSNPFKFGLIGATDSHTSLSTTEEDNFFGKLSYVEPNNMDRFKYKTPGFINVKTLASGLAGVWAKENTRESIWDAIMRKEVYASTGTRMTVRVFAGWNYQTDDIERPDFVHIGYQGGVPMGGDLGRAPEGSSPKLLVQALRDPDGANLDRIQIVKGWIDKAGQSQERIYDVACSGGRAIKSRRCSKPVGNSVDIKTATYVNNIGNVQLSTFWEDPDFNARQEAFYYIRVLEIPTPRWTTYDAVRFGVDLPNEVPATHQERAYTSPIWYTPTPNS